MAGSRRFPEDDGRHPSKEATPARLRLSPPKWLFGFVNDIAPGKADIMQVAIGQLGQFTTRLVAPPPGAECFAELGQKPGTMMICHRFMCESGHLYLLKLICWLEYRR
jgi:hypothetical protein